MEETVRRVSVVLFEGFELLDVFGPVELLSLAPGIRVEYVGPAAGPVASSQGGEVVAQHAHGDLADPDILLVPGGMGTRRLVARWVHDRDRWTSSGVAAGMDMTAALIADLRGTQAARAAARLAEYEPYTDAACDPFAAIHGLAD